MRRILALMLLAILLAVPALAENVPVAAELAIAMGNEIPEMQDVRAHADTGLANGAIWTDERLENEGVLFVHADEAAADAYSVEHTTKQQSVRALGCCTISMDSALPPEEAQAYMQALAGALGVEAEEPDYILNVNTKKFHQPDCASVSEMKDSNKLPYTGERSVLDENSYVPCKRCKPE